MRYVLLSLLFVACAKPLQPVDPEPAPAVADAGPGCAAACASLRKIGCPEGNGSSDTCEHRCAVAEELRGLPVACWAKAHSVAEATACGQLRCVK